MLGDGYSVQEQIIAFYIWWWVQAILKVCVTMETGNSFPLRREFMLSQLWDYS